MTEDQLEAAITQYLTLALPPDAVMFHVPNEGKRGRRAQSQAKRAGMVRGVPDRVIIWQGNAIFLEAKAKGKYPTREQREIMERLTDAGARCAVVRSLESVYTLLGENMGIPLRARPAYALRS